MNSTDPIPAAKADQQVFACPDCGDHDLLVESRDQTVQYGPLDREPDCDMDGVYFSGLPQTAYTVYCPDCGEVTAAELLDHLND